MSEYKNFLTQKELKIKMSFLLNVSNGSSKCEEFSRNDIEMLVDSEEQNWFKRTHVGKFLEIEDIRTSLNGVEKCKMLARKDIKAVLHDTGVGLDRKINKVK